MIASNKPPTEGSMNYYCFLCLHQVNLPFYGYAYADPPTKVCYNLIPRKAYHTTHAICCQCLAAFVVHWINTAPVEELMQCINEDWTSSEYYLSYHAHILELYKIRLSGTPESVYPFYQIMLDRGTSPRTAQVILGDYEQFLVRYRKLLGV